MLSLFCKTSSVFIKFSFQFESTFETSLSINDLIVILQSEFKQLIEYLNNPTSLIFNEINLSDSTLIIFPLFNSTSKLLLSTPSFMFNSLLKELTFFTLFKSSISSLICIDNLIQLGQLTNLAK